MFNLFRKPEVLIENITETIEFKNELKQSFNISEQVAISIVNHMHIFTEKLNVIATKRFKIYENLGFIVKNDIIKFDKRNKLDISKSSDLAFIKIDYFHYFIEIQKELSLTKVTIPTKYCPIFDRFLGKLIYQYYVQFREVNDEICDIIIHKSMEQSEFHLLELFIETNKSADVIENFHQKAKKIQAMNEISDTMERIRKKFDSNLDNL